MVVGVPARPVGCVDDGRHKRQRDGPVDVGDRDLLQPAAPEPAGPLERRM